jgi:hypothetical protein
VVAVSRELKEFEKDLKVGQAYEDRLIAYLKQWYEVRKATIDQQLQGIDFIIRKPTGDTTVELKADSRSAETGNAFIETMSRFEDGVYGWAWTTRADLLIYWVVPSEIIVARPSDIRDALTAKDVGWIYKYPTRLICNRAWHTQGYLVPLEELKEIAVFCGSIDA